METFQPSLYGRIRPGQTVHTSSRWNAEDGDWVILETNPVLTFPLWKNSGGQTVETSWRWNNQDGAKTMEGPGRVRVAKIKISINMLRGGTRTQFQKFMRKILSKLKSPSTHLHPHICKRVLAWWGQGHLDIENKLIFLALSSVGSPGYSVCTM